MEMMFGVADFGKIERAEIMLGDFTMFVGDNNSGKTFIMQLIYGVMKKLSALSDMTDGVIEEEERLEFAQEWFDFWENEINEYLSENKEKIISEIFHKPIPIGELYFRFINVDERFVCEISEFENPLFDGSEKEDVVIPAMGKMVEIRRLGKEEDEIRPPHRVRFHSLATPLMIRRAIEKRVKKMVIGWGLRAREDILFMPASRTGLQLLYKYLFAERDKKSVEEYEMVELEDNDGTEGNELGLSSPVYDFLQFLLRYTPVSALNPQNRRLLRFIENYLIGGQLKQVGEETYYLPKKSTEEIPLYLASSLVNEVAPIVKAIGSTSDFKYIFYDEIETCLHPLKQGEMARLIMRLVNSGKRMIVSTHSDTMATKINNLLLLSFADLSDKQRQEKMKKLELKKSDLLESQDVHVYQFVNEANGRSSVEELKFRTQPYIGYDFGLFMKNLDTLYEEYCLGVRG